jgi:hypothetical protein
MHPSGTDWNLMNPTNTQLELMRRCLDGEASDEEFAQLEELLRNDPKFRMEYLRYLNVDSALVTLPKDAKRAGKSGHKLVAFPRWRPLAAAAAAGLILGLFCASVAWAVVAPRKSNTPVVIPILTESFETATTPITDGFPTRTGEWGGDRAQIVGPAPNRRPLEGNSVLSLESSPDHNLGFFQQIIDVSPLPHAGEGEMRVIEVIASYLADQPGETERYTLRVASFKESPEKIRNLWEGVTWREMDKISLTFSKTGLSAPREATGWQTLSAIVEAPADARSVVISLAAGRLDRRAPKTPHYVDDVRAELRIIPFKKRLSPKRR